MKKILCPAIALALLLTACAQAPRPSPMPSPSETATTTPTPSPEPSEEPKELWGFPIDETHDAFEVDTGGKLGTVLVTVEIAELEHLYRFAVWAQDDTETPIQKMEVEGSCSGMFRDYAVIDANFDGYMDFRYQRSWGTGGFFFYYWVWAEEKQQFTAVPQLTEYGGDVVFNAETETILAHESMKDYVGFENCEDIYIWENGSPICVRKIRWFPRFETEDTFVNTITVFDCVSGTLTEVYSTQSTEDDFWDELEPWYDLDYHG